VDGTDNLVHNRESHVIEDIHVNVTKVLNEDIANIEIPENCLFIQSRVPFEGVDEVEEVYEKRSKPRLDERKEQCKAKEPERPLIRGKLVERVYKGAKPNVLYTPSNVVRATDLNTDLTKEQRNEIQFEIDTVLLQEFYNYIESPELALTKKERIRIGQKMTEIVYLHENEFRVRAVFEEASRFQPYKPNIRKDARPFPCKTPRYSTAQSEAAETIVNQHIRVGHWTVNMEAIYCSPLMMVPKPGAEPPYRPTVNMKNVNQIFQPVQWPFPQIKVQFQRIKQKNSKFFGTTDVQGGYFQMLINEAYRSYFAIMTDKTVVVPERLIQGSTDAAKYFQSQLAHALKDHIPDDVLQWLDDFILHCETLDELVELWSKFFVICQQYNVKLSIKKTHLAKNEIDFTGHTLDKDGYEFNPRNYETVGTMTVPKDGRQLQQFVSCTNWMREAIPLYATTIAPLNQILQKIYEKKRNRTKYGMQKFQLMDFGWRDIHLKAFKSIQNAIIERIKLYIPSNEDTICMFTDASSFGWSGCLTAVKNFNSEKPIHEQQHNPLGFVSGVFTGSEVRWGIQCKEAFAIKETCTKLAHITRCFKFRMYTDSNNLSYIYKRGHLWPQKDVPRATEQRLENWGELLDNFEYELFHIPGDIMENKCFVDIISRWMNPDQETMKKEKLRLLSYKSRIKPIKLDSFHNHGYSTNLNAFEWPSTESILELQEKYRKDKNSPVIEQTRRDGLYSKKGSTEIWIPMKALELRVSLCILGHCTLSGHRGLETTKSNLKEYTWETKKTDIEQFCSTCLQCHQTKGGRTIPRPWGHTVTGRKRNHVISFDYLYIQSAPNSGIHLYQYLLVVKDTYSHYVRLYTCESADAATTAEALSDWIAIFGIQKDGVPQMLSDCGTHFKNEVIETLVGRFGLEVNHFTTPYCPFANGSVERVNLDILNLLTLLLAESGQPFEHWPYFICPIMDILNSYPSKVLDDLSPREVQMGLDRTNIVNLVTFIPVTEESIEILLEGTTIGEHVDILQKSIAEMHKKVDITKEKRRQVNRKIRENQSKPADFTIGCYVLHGIVKNKIKSKLQIKWAGPYRVTKTLNAHLYEIQNLLDKDDVFIAHATRLKFYSYKSMKQTELLDDNLKVQESLRFKVKNIVEHKYNAQSQQYEFLIEWTGFSSFDNSWEPVLNILADVPIIVHNYVKKLVNTNKDKIVLEQIITSVNKQMSTVSDKRAKKKERKSTIKKRKRKKSLEPNSTDKRRKNKNRF